MDNKLEELHNLYGKHQRRIIGKCGVMQWATCNCGRLYCAYDKPLNQWWRVTDTNISGMDSPIDQRALIKSNPLAEKVLSSLPSDHTGNGTWTMAATPYD